MALPLCGARGRIAAAAGGLAVAVLLMAQGGAAIAEPRPTVAQARARLAKLADKADQMVERYNAATERYKAAKKTYIRLNDELTREQDRVRKLRENLVTGVVGSYQSGDLPVWAMGGGGDPGAMLSGLAAVDQISAGRAQVLRDFDAATRGLRVRRGKAKGAYDAAARLRADIGEEKEKVEKLVGEQERLLRRLNQYNPGDPNSRGIQYTGPASGNARTALQFAFAQVGKPYRYGATGPGSYDCSGFTQASWAKAGVKLPRTTWTQWSWGASRRVPLDRLQPGDLLFSRGLGHMGMYAGGGKMIHAPRTGDVVKVVALDDYWRGRLLGAIRP